MKKTVKCYSIAIFLMSTLFCASVLTQTTGFAYQGSLQNAGVPATGNFDFEFALFDALSGGGQLGSTIAVNNVGVANGIFSVVLDFGNQFPGAGRFLEIRVKQTGGGGITTLSPRQPVGSVPYSVKSLTAETAVTAVSASNSVTAGNALQLGGVAANLFLQTNGNGSGLTNLSANNITTGTLNNARLGLIPTANIADSAVTSSKIATGQVVKTLNSLTDSVTLAAGSNITITPSGNTLTIASTGGANAILNQTTQQAAANFNISGTGAADVFAAFSQYNIGNARVLTADSSNIIVGVGAGADMPPNTNNNSFVGRDAGRSTSGGGNSFFGSGAGQDNVTGTGNTLIGRGTSLGTTNLAGATALGHRAFVSQSNSLILGAINGVNEALADTRVGIGTTAPEKHLHVAGLGNQEMMIESTDSGGIKWTLQASSGASEGRFEIIDRTANASRITILNDGLVGIGTTAPLDRFHVNGIIRVATLGAAGATTLCRNASNQIATCSSSARYKSDIHPFGSGLGLIKQLRPVSFAWRDGGMRDMGLVAEEVNAVEPLLTTTNDKGEVEGVKYDRVGVVLINAVKEQQDQIDLLKRQNTLQQNQIELQQKQIRTLTLLVCAANKDAEICKEKL